MATPTCKSSMANVVARWKRYIFPTGVLLYIICYGIFYPNFYAIQDERIYLAKAYQFSQGYFFSGNPNPVDFWIEKYPPGQALLLSLFLKIDYRYIYLLNPLLLLLLTLILVGLLKRNNIPDYFALLVLFHPAMLVFSRTIMSDIPAAFFFLLAAWLLIYRKNAHFFGALALGFTNSLRVALIPFSLHLLLYALWQRKNRGSDVLQTLVGFFFGAVPFLYYFYHANFFYGTYTHNIETMSAARILPHAVTYLLSLNLVYPLMFGLGVLTRYNEDLFVKSVCVLTVVFFPIFEMVPGEDLLMMLTVLYQRYFLFIIGPLLIGYSVFLSRRIVTNEIRFILLLVVLVIGSFALSSLHQNFLKQNYGLHKIIYANTTENSLLITDDRVEKYIQDLFGRRKTLNMEGVRDPEDIFHQVELFQGGDIFVVYIIEENALLRFILDHYQSEEIVNYNNKWNLRIFKISKFT